jgi:hypothetical protein
MFANTCIVAKASRLRPVTESRQLQSAVNMSFNQDMFGFVGLVMLRYYQSRSRCRLVQRFAVLGAMGVRR